MAPRRNPGGRVPSVREARQVMDDTSPETPVGAALQKLHGIVARVMLSDVGTPTVRDREIAEATADQVCAMGALEGVFAHFMRPRRMT